MDTEVEYIDEMIALWKKLKVAKCVMEFSCGGDSMNDTSFTFKNRKGEEIESSELDSYFEDAVYNNVNFYECSDGVYEGEFGQVIIKLNKAGDDFDYVKKATAEYNEDFYERTTIELPENIMKFLQKNVQDVTGDLYNDDTNVTYKRDLVLTDADETLIKELEEKLTVLADNYEFQKLKEEEHDETRGFTTSKENDAPLKIKGNKLTVYITCRYTKFEKAED